MNAKLCVTVFGASTAELRAKRDAAIDADADMVELRVDGARNLDVPALLAGRRRPVIVTCRPVREGGRFAGSEEERYTILRRAFDLGAEFVDVEWDGPYEALVAAEQGRRIVLSTHDFEGFPSDMEARYLAMHATGAQVVKIAVTVDRLAELARLRDLPGRKRSNDGRDRVVIGMGPVGVPSRLLPDTFGSAWTYAGGPDVAPGQITIRRMLDEYGVRRAGPDTEIYGVLGKPLAHSLSPAMHNAGFADRERNAAYVPLEASDVSDFWRFAEAFDVRGASVTAPYKAAVIDRLADVDSLGQRVGAVNTLRRTTMGWEGLNTDVPGFLAPLQRRMTLAGSRASVLGAGGAARGVALALADGGAQVAVHARNRTRAQTVADMVGGRVGPWPPPAGSWDLLVNTTPLGTYPRVDASPIGGPELGGGLVYDLVYNPRTTRLLREAAAAGCETVGGLEMLVAQAELQFAWWTGIAPARGLFQAAAERALAALAGAVGQDETS